MVLVVVVDDEAFVRDSFSKLIQTRGYDTESFSSAEQLLASNAVSRADCFLLDYRLPGMDCRTLTRHLRSASIKTPVILLSGDGVVGGMDDVENLATLPKPCMPDVLFELLGKSIEDAA